MDNLVQAVGAVTIDATKLNPDKEWQELHAWSTKFRKDNNMTCEQFLIHFNIERKSTFFQLLSAGGRPGTQGFALRTALRKALDESKSSPIPVSLATQQSPSKAMENIYRESRKEWQQKGLISLVVSAASSVPCLDAIVTSTSALNRNSPSCSL